MQLEICANSYQSAYNAQIAGAHRIELCQELSVGGITPSFGLIKQVLSQLTIPVFVLIRPRAGNFIYSDSEFEIMKQDIELCKSVGCAGVVSGILNANKTIDIERTKILIEIAGSMQFTFHRAFDEVFDPEKALKQLIELRVSRVLTSGQKKTAQKGLVLLEQLLRFSNDKILILPGSGINASNVRLFKDSGFKEIHASASSVVASEDSLFSRPLSYSDPLKIKAILNAI